MKNSIKLGIEDIQPDQKKVLWRKTLTDTYFACICPSLSGVFFY